MKEQRLVDWDAIVRHFESMTVTASWAFRGMCDARWPLKTSLERHIPSEGITATASEARMLREFKRRAHTYLPSERIPAQDDTAEWLSLMQHHGAPTRLLDVTRSPYVATYFALEAAPVADECAVWAFDTFWCRDAAGTAILREQPERRRVLEQARAGGAIQGLDGLTPEQIQGLESSLLLGDRWRTNQSRVVVPFEPERLSERLSIQQGSFLVPRDVERPFMDNLEALGDSAEHVIKYTIPTVSRGRILERLRIMNITRAQLFPGLDGFAESFKTHLVSEPLASLERRLIIQALQGSLNLRG